MYLAFAAMKTFSVGSKVVTFIWMHIHLADGNGDFEYSNLEHLGMKSHRGVKSLKLSSLGCAIACVLNVDCASFSYDLQTRICVLRDTILGNTNMDYDKCNCHDDKGYLDLGLKWQMFRRHQPYVPVCAKRAVLMTARRRVSNGITTYTCENQDYKICFKKNISGHQYRWENRTGVCGQFRWRNPPTSSNMVPPFDSLEEFGVTVRGTPHGNKKWGIGIQKESDVLFYSDFRFFRRYNLAVSVMNTFFGKWFYKKEIRANVTMPIGEESVVKIILQHGLYMLIINDVSIYKFTERKSGAKPSHITVKGYVSVGMVEFMSYN